MQFLLIRAKTMVVKWKMIYMENSWTWSVILHKSKLFSDWSPDLDDKPSMSSEILAVYNKVKIQ